MLSHPLLVFFIFNWIIQCLLRFIRLPFMFEQFFRVLLLIILIVVIVFERKIKYRILHEPIDITVNNFIRIIDFYFLEQAAPSGLARLHPFVYVFLIHYYSIINQQDMQIQPRARLNMIAEHIQSQSSLVIYESNNRVLTLTLNRPKALNSINLEVVRNITKNYDFINSHEVVWFQGSGGKSFCAGGDVKILYEKQATVDFRKTFFRQQFQMDYKISQLKAIQISCWDGIVMGGGVGVSIFAPIIIATQKTLFAMPEAKLGFFTDVGVNYILARMRNNIGYYLGMTGARLKGEQVYAAGLAHFYIPSSKINQVHNEIVRFFKDNQNCKDAKQKIIQILNKYHGSTKKVIDNEQKINQIFSSSSPKEIYNNVKDAKDNFSQNVFKLLEQQCPVSVALIHKLITLAKSSTLRQVFVTDTIVVEHMCSNADMKEGVRCVLLQKGAMPKWSIPSIDKVGGEVVQSFLIPIEKSIPFQG